jgi:hypothetical protein
LERNKGETNSGKIRSVKPQETYRGRVRRAWLLNLRRKKKHREGRGNAEKKDGTQRKERRNTEEKVETQRSRAERRRKVKEFKNWPAGLDWVVDETGGALPEFFSPAETSVGDFKKLFSSSPFMTS